MGFFSQILFLYFLVLTDALFTATTNGASLLQNVCSQTPDPNLCLRELLTDPNTSRATLTQLTQLTIDAVEFNAGQTKIKIHSFLLTTKNPQLLQIYEKCENLYVDALNTILSAYDDLKTGRYGVVLSKAQFVRNAPIACHRLFRNNVFPFTNENHLVEILSDALVVEATDLLKL